MTSNENNTISITNKDKGTIKGPKVRTTDSSANPSGLIQKGGGAKIGAGGKAEAGNGKNPGTASGSTTKGY